MSALDQTGTKRAYQVVTSFEEYKDLFYCYDLFYVIIYCVLSLLIEVVIVFFNSMSSNMH